MCNCAAQILTISICKSGQKICIFLSDPDDFYVLLTTVALEAESEPLRYLPPLSSRSKTTPMTQCRVEVRIRPRLFQEKLKERVRNAQVSPLSGYRSPPGYELRLEKHLPARPRACSRPQSSPCAARPTTVFRAPQFRSPPLGPASPSTSRYVITLPAAPTNGTVVGKAFWEM